MHLTTYTRHQSLSILSKLIIEYRRGTAGNVIPPGYSWIRNSIQGGPRGGEPGHVHHDRPGHRRAGAGHAGLGGGPAAVRAGGSGRAGSPRPRPRRPAPPPPPPPAA